MSEIISIRPYGSDCLKSQDNPRLVYTLGVRFAEDPDALNNLYMQQRESQRLIIMRKHLRRHMEETDDPALERFREAVKDR